MSYTGVDRSEQESQIEREYHPHRLLIFKYKMWFMLINSHRILCDFGRRIENWIFEYVCLAECTVVASGTNPRFSSFFFVFEIRRVAFNEQESVQIGYRLNWRPSPAPNFKWRHQLQKGWEYIGHSSLHLKISQSFFYSLQF